LKLANCTDFIIGGIALLFLALTLSDGIGLSFDFNLLLQGAEHIKENGLNRLFEAGAFRAKPPLFPIFLYLLDNNLLLIAWSNFLFYACSLCLSFYMVDQLIIAFSYRILLKSTIAFSTPLLLIHEFLLPEPIFMVVWYIHLIAVIKMMNLPSSKWISILLITSILLIGLRHIGIVLVTLTGSFLFYHLRQTTFKIWSVVSLSIPSFLFFLWQYLLSNHVGHYERLDHFSGVDIFGNTLQVVIHFTKWFFPNTGMITIDLTVSLITICCIAYLVRLSIGRSKSNVSFKYFLVILIFVFPVFIILKGDLIYSDIERYLSIIYLPLFILIISGLEQFQATYSIHKNIIVFTYTIWLIYPLIRMVNNVLLWSGLGV